MARSLRYLPQESALVEVTTRTLQGRFLLRPSRKLNELVVGVIGRALKSCPGVDLHAIGHLSNHLHMLLTVKDSAALSDFMCFVNGNTAREAGLLHRWREKFWGRRYECIPVLDDETAVKRLRYLLAHGCKEGFSRRPLDWVGINSARALLDNEPLRGRWYNRKAAYEARRRGQHPGPDDFSEVYEVHLVPLPAWSNLPKETRQALGREMLDGIERKFAGTAGRHPDGGARAVCRVNPHRRPSRVARSPAPDCHAADKSLRKQFREGYVAFARHFHEAARAQRRHRPKARFPYGCFPPAPAFLPVSSRP